VPLDWPEVFADANALSVAYSAKLLTRSLDLLHVAAARAIKGRTFVSADDRQLALARAAKLKVVDIKRTLRATRR
jgi:predicted nucleic acid-binding protein